MQLAINIASFSHLLKRVDFDTIIDHLALTHFIKSKVEPVTTRIKRLLELISSYSFNFYYMKGKDMILSDVLSRQKYNNSNLHKIIPISPGSSWHGKEFGSQSKARKNSIPYPNKVVWKGLCIGQGRAGLRRKRPDPINQSIN